MKTVSDFLSDVRENDQPSGEMSDCLQALWWEAKGDWDRAHDIAQDAGTRDGDEDLTGLGVDACLEEVIVVGITQPLHWAPVQPGIIGPVEAAPLVPVEGGPEDEVVALAPEAVELEAVSLRYPGTVLPALERLSLRLAPGERLALCGASGAGKSSVASLLLPNQPYSLVVLARNSYGLGWRSNTLCATNARNRLCITTADLARSFISARLMWPREFFCICSTPFFICFSSSIADLRRHTCWITSAASSKCRSTLDWNSFTKLDKAKSSIECARAWPAGCDAFALPPPASLIEF